MGAAMLAASADTGVAVRELAAQWVRPVGAVEPDPARAALYMRGCSSTADVLRASDALRRADRSGGADEDLQQKRLPARFRRLRRRSGGRNPGGVGG